MKQMFKNISIFALSVCCGVFYSVDSQSKVCFLGDENCTDNVSFDFNFIDVEEECKKEGYTIKAENCKTPYEYCPHSNMWVKCCNEQEYYYDSCDNNTTEKGRCGYGNNYKYKCECDESIYEFESCDTDTEGPKRSVDTRYSCTEKDYNGNKTTLYAKCSCDGSYKYKAEDCEAFENSEPQNACSHDYSDGFPWGKDTTTYYAQCGCNRSIYKEESCGDMGTFGKICKDSQGNTYAENCKSCNGYHDGAISYVGFSEDKQCGFSNGETADGSGYDTTNCSYVICPHDSSKYKIIRCDGKNFKSTPADNGKKCVCEDGFELNENNQCVAKMTCNQAVIAFLAYVKYPGTNHSYPVLTNDGIVHYQVNNGELTSIPTDIDDSSLGVLVYDINNDTPQNVTLPDGEPDTTKIVYGCTKISSATAPWGYYMKTESNSTITPKNINNCAAGVNQWNCQNLIFYATAGKTPIGNFTNFYGASNYAGYMGSQGLSSNKYLQNMREACANVTSTINVGSGSTTLRFRRSRCDGKSCVAPGLNSNSNCVWGRISPLGIGEGRILLYNIDLHFERPSVITWNVYLTNGKLTGEVYHINNGKVHNNTGELSKYLPCGTDTTTLLGGMCPSL